MEESLSSWLRTHYPRDVLMPLEKGLKRPMFSHKDHTWSWFRYLTKRQRDADVAILLVDLCVIDVDCHSVAMALEERFTVLKTVPCEDTKKGRHYLFSRSTKADTDGFYDGAKQHNSQIDFKTICSNGTSGIVAVSPSTGKSWREHRAPWLCFPDGRIPQIPDDLLEHVARARHRPISCSLHFLIDNETRNIDSCNLMTGSAYLDVFVRDPLGNGQDSSKTIIPVPNFRATTFDEMLFVCATGELRLTQADAINDSARAFEAKIETICELADFLGMPARYDQIFRRPYGYLWGLCRLHNISRHLSAVTIVENLWRYRLGTHINETKSEWMQFVVEISPTISKQIRYQPIDSPRDSFLFHRRPSMASFFPAGCLTVRPDPQNIQMPPIVSAILTLARDTIMLAGGSVLGKLATLCAEGADYDLFFFGIHPQQASETLMSIASLPDVSELHRSEHAITFGADGLVFQIITRLFRNPAEVLHGFDINACKVGVYKDTNDRMNILATPSWIESMRHRTVWVDERTWSLSSAVRLCKYYCKGFDVLIPGLTRGAMDKSVDLRQSLDTFDGISLLLAMECQLNTQYRNKHDLGTRIRSTWLDRMVLTKMKRHRDCDYTTFMKTTRCLQSWWNWLLSRNGVKDPKPHVLIWSIPTAGRRVSGTFAQSPLNLKDILLL